MLGTTIRACLKRMYSFGRNLFSPKLLGVAFVDYRGDNGIACIEVGTAGLEACTHGSILTISTRAIQTTDGKIYVYAAGTVIGYVDMQSGRITRY